MKIFNRFRKPEERKIDGEYLRVFGLNHPDLPQVTEETAMHVPAVAAAIGFLSGALANLPIHVYRSTGDGSVRDRGDLSRFLNEAANDEWNSYVLRQYFWSQVFGMPGRGLLYIERAGSKVLGFWPMNAAATVIKRNGGRRVYVCEGKIYEAHEVIDVPFLLKADQLSSFSAIRMGGSTIQQALAMGEYAAKFFAGGGVPPLALTGPLPSGAEAMKRASQDVKRVIDHAVKNQEALFPIPPGHELKPVGFDPEKGQMVDARRFMIEEFARLWGLPPVFLQDLTHGTHTNTEQQDLFLVKHLISRWAKAFEDEINLKVFGARRNKKYVEHNLDGLLRGDLKSRMEAFARGIFSSQITPDEVRALENRPPLPGGDKLYIQGATVPLGSQPTEGAKPDPQTEGADDTKA